MQRIPLLALAVLLSASTSAARAQRVSAPSGSSSLLTPAVPDSAPAPAAAFTPPPTISQPGYGGVGIGVSLGTLGIGFEGAVPLTPHFNIRGGGHFFNYNDTLSSSGVNYTGSLQFRSAEAELDWFPWAKSFHISPGALLYNGNHLSGHALIPAGDTFTLNHTTYMSSASDPVHGAGSVDFAKAAPKLTVGWGNLLPRNGRHFSFPFEAGFAYEGDPRVALSFTGTACDANGQGCEPIATDPTTQANVAAQQAKVTRDARMARFYPILSSGFAVRF